MQNREGTLKDDICFLTVSLANLAAFALNFNGVRSLLAFWSSDCKTEIIQNSHEVFWFQRNLRQRK